MASKKRISYSEAGVNIDEADRAVSMIKVRARETFTKGVLTDIGTFGAGYLLQGWKQPVLISSADGVGTKLKIAVMSGRHDTIGEDLVNHCVNDIAVQGADSALLSRLFFSRQAGCGSGRSGCLGHGARL